MASKRDVVDFILEQIGTRGAPSARRMFGEYGLYSHGKLFGLVCDDQLFIKPTDAGRAFLGGDATEAQPYPGAKPCFVIPGECWEDGDYLAELVRITAAALPTPKAKKPRST